MESMGKKRPRPRRSFMPEFKAEIVELCQRGDRTVGQVSKDFDLTETAVREWVKQAVGQVVVTPRHRSNDHHLHWSRYGQEGRAGPATAVALGPAFAGAAQPR
jgi:transposase